MKRMDKLASDYVKRLLDAPERPDTPPRAGYFETYIAGYEQALQDALDAAKCLKGADTFTWVLERLRDSQGSTIDFTTRKHTHE